MEHLVGVTFFLGSVLVDLFQISRHHLPLLAFPFLRLLSLLFVHLQRIDLECVSHLIFHLPLLLPFKKHDGSHLLLGRLHQPAKTIFEELLEDFLELELHLLEVIRRKGQQAALLDSLDCELAIVARNVERVRALRLLTLNPLDFVF